MAVQMFVPASLAPGLTSRGMSTRIGAGMPAPDEDRVETRGRVASALKAHVRNLDERFLAGRHRSNESEETAEGRPDHAWEPGVVRAACLPPDCADPPGAASLASPCVLRLPPGPALGCSI